MVATLKLIGGSSTAGITTLISDGQRMDGAIYNLQGVRVQAPTKKGIYVRNGKKFIVK